MNALQLFRWQFSNKETLEQTFFKRSAILHRKLPFCVFEPPSLRYDDHLRLTGKRVVDFLLVLIELFRWVLRLRRYERISVENRRFRSNGANWPKLSGRRGRFHQPLFFSKSQAKWYFVWYKNLDTSFFRFVTMHAFDGQTEFWSLDRVCIPCYKVQST